MEKTSAKPEIPIPQCLKIGGHVVKIELTDYEPHTFGNQGTSWNCYNLIQVSTKFPPSQQKATLLHEIVHHIFTNLGLDFDKSNKAESVHNEQFVEALAQALFQVLHDNQSLRF